MLARVQTAVTDDRPDDESDQEGRGHEEADGADQAEAVHRDDVSGSGHTPM